VYYFALLYVIVYNKCINFYKLIVSNWYIYTEICINNW